MTTHSKEQAMPSEMRLWTIEQFIAIEKKTLSHDRAVKFLKMLSTSNREKHPEIVECFVEAMEICGNM